MEALRQDLIFWKLIHHLVITEKFRVIEVSPNYHEIWLEQDQKRKGSILRIARTDIDWSNWLRNDIERSAKKFEVLRKQLGKLSLKGHNVYISTYPPVDSWDHLVREPFLAGAKGQTNIHSLVIDNEQVLPSLSSLFSQLDLPIPDLQSWLETNIDMDTTLKSEVLVEAENRLKAEKELFLYGKPIFTYFLLIVNIFMFVLLESVGSSTSILTLIEFGAKHNPLIIEGEWWRLLSAIFLHIGILHLVMNSLALFYLGSSVERIYGSTRFVIIYIVAGLFGSIASFALNTQIAAGASGAIFGCFGALLYFGVIHRTLFFRTMGMSIIIILLINLTFGFTIPMIDNGAHIGGLVGGFLASSFVHLPKHKNRILQVGTFAITILAMGGLFSFGLANNNGEEGSLTNVQIAQEILHQEDTNHTQEDIERAYNLLKKEVENGIDLPEAYFLLAYTEAYLGYYADAEKHLVVTIEKEPSFHEAHYNLALIYMELKQYEKALLSVERAIDLNRNNEQYLQLKDDLLQQIN